ncbi:hypothetical protein ACA910_003815 [Epithemia clementina (nom. ined.)]
MFVVVGEESVHALTERITADLRVFVLERVKSTRNLTVPDDNSTSSVEIEFAPIAEEQGNEEKMPHRSFISSSKSNSVSASGQASDEGEGDIEQADEFKKRVSFYLLPGKIETDEPNSEVARPAIEFLDLIQIVSAMLIPCFSRFVHDSRNQKRGCS